MPTLPCEFGGSVDLTGTSNGFYVLHAEYRDCVTRATGWECKQHGVVAIALSNPPYEEQRLKSVRFGVADTDFVEQRRPLTSTAPSRLSLNYRIDGSVVERDASGQPIAGAYDVLVDGSLTDEHQERAEGRLKLHSIILDAERLLVKGGNRVTERSSEHENRTFLVTTTQYASGTLTHDTYAQDGLPEFVRKQWTFDVFKVIVADDPVTGEVRRSLDGRVTVNRAESATAGCVDGALAFDTPITIVETARDSSGFVAGLVRIDEDALIRLSNATPRVAIDAHGTTIALLSGAALFGYGSCKY